MKKPKTSHHGIPTEVLDELLRHSDSLAPDAVLGPNGLLKRLTGALVERVLAEEMDHHLGYAHGDRRPGGQPNARNGTSKKTLLTEHGSVPIEVPRDREASFQPVIVPKHKRRMAAFEDKVLALYARGMSVRDIRDQLEELYGTKVSPDLISSITDAILDELHAWRSRPLQSRYPVLYIDALRIKVRADRTIHAHAVYVALGIGLNGQKEVLGMWMSQNEGAQFWLKVLTELKKRGVEDFLFICCDGLSGMAQAIQAAFPQAIHQTCIVHVIRNSLSVVPWSDRRAVAKSLKPIYTAPTEEAALVALESFESEWGDKYPLIARRWLERWEEISPFLSYSAEIRRVVYTTNPIESVNRVLRKAVKTRSVFPTQNAVYKVLYLAIQRLEKKWTRPDRYPPKNTNEGLKASTASATIRTSEDFFHHYGMSRTHTQCSTVRPRAAATAPPRPPAYLPRSIRSSSTRHICWVAA